MNPGKLHKSMDSMMNACENMEMPMFGSILLIYLITYPLQLLLRVRFAGRFN